jgi:hypothetical protein
MMKVPLIRHETLGYSFASIHLQEQAFEGMKMSQENANRLELLRSAPLNSWIALSEDESRIVATGSTYSEAAERSERAGESDPVIIKTPERWAPLSI